MTGGTGLYCGEQDMFCFLIDPQGWTDIGGEAFIRGEYKVEPLTQGDILFQCPVVTLSSQAVWMSHHQLRRMN